MVETSLWTTFVSHSQGQTLANKLNAVKYIECSSQIIEGIQEVFVEAAKAGLYMTENQKGSRSLCNIALSPIPALIHVVDLSRISSLVPTSRKGVFGQCCRISGYHYNKDDAVFTWTSQHETENVKTHNRTTQFYGPKTLLLVKRCGHASAPHMWVRCQCHIHTYCIVFLFCFSSSCIPYVASFSGLSIFYSPFRILQRFFNTAIFL
jgi:hypothetical protein